MRDMGRCRRYPRSTTVGKSSRRAPPSDPARVTMPVVHVSASRSLALFRKPAPLLSAFLLSNSMPERTGTPQITCVTGVTWRVAASGRYILGPLHGGDGDAPDHLRLQLDPLVRYVRYRTLPYVTSVTRLTDGTSPPSSARPPRALRTLPYVTVRYVRYTTDRRHSISVFSSTISCVTYVTVRYVRYTSDRRHNTSVFSSTIS